MIVSALTVPRRIGAFTSPRRIGSKIWRKKWMYPRPMALLRLSDRWRVRGYAQPPCWVASVARAGPVRNALRMMTASMPGHHREQLADCKQFDGRLKTRQAAFKPKPG